MRDGKHRDVTRESNEHDVIRKVVDGQAPYVSVCNPRNKRSCFGKLFEVQERLPDFGSESIGYFAAAFAIPSSCLTQFATRAFAEANGSQRDNTSR